MTTVHPFVIVSPKGLEYVGLHENEAACWHVWLGWPDDEEIEAAKAKGFQCYRASVTWQEDGAHAKTCDRCRHYSPPKATLLEDYIYAGACALMGDSAGDSPRVAQNRAASWDQEDYMSGVYVGPKFGCIHWVQR